MSIEIFVYRKSLISNKEFLLDQPTTTGLP